MTSFLRVSAIRVLVNKNISFLFFFFFHLNITIQLRLLILIFLSVECIVIIMRFCKVLCVIIRVICSKAWKIWSYYSEWGSRWPKMRLLLGTSVLSVEERGKVCTIHMWSANDFRSSAIITYSRETGLASAREFQLLVFTIDITVVDHEYEEEIFFSSCSQWFSRLTPRPIDVYSVIIARLLRHWWVISSFILFPQETILQWI